MTLDEAVDMAVNREVKHKTFQLFLVTYQVTGKIFVGTENIFVETYWIRDFSTKTFIRSVINDLR